MIPTPPSMVMDNDKTMRFAKAPGAWREIRAMSRRPDEGAPAKLPPPPTTASEKVAHHLRALSRLRPWRRRGFCHGPCTLGGSFAGLCKECPRK